MNQAEALVIIGTVTAIVVGLVRLVEFIEKDAKDTWWIVAEGIYVQSVPEKISSRIATGMTGYYAKLPAMIWTTLVFEDGRRIKVINVEDLPLTGTSIRVLKNKRAEFKIETAK